MSNVDNLSDAVVNLRLDAGLTCNRMCMSVVLVFYLKIFNALMFFWIFSIFGRRLDASIPPPFWLEFS